jgi:hypothetical protein
MLKKGTKPMIYPIFFFLGFLLNMGIALAFAVNGALGLGFAALFVAICAMVGMIYTTLTSEGF